MSVPEVPQAAVPLMITTSPLQAGSKKTQNVVRFVKKNEAYEDSLTSCESYSSVQSADTSSSILQFKE